MNKSILFWLAILLVFAGGMTCWSAYKIYEQSTATAAAGSGSLSVSAPKPPQSQDWLTEYTLTERSGRQFDSNELDGEVHLVSFFFSNCPTFCSFQNQKIQEVHEEFKDEGVKFVSITCDPETDTPERLREYARKFNAGEDSWLFLTGNLTYLRRVAAEIYQVALDRQTHSETLLVMDKWGNLRGRFHWNKPEEMAALRETLPQLLAESKPPAEFAEQAATEADAAEPVAAEPDAAEQGADEQDGAGDAEEPERADADTETTAA